MQNNLRVVILTSILLFGFQNINYSLPTRENEIPTVKIHGGKSKMDISERQLWLIQESLSYALHKTTGIPDNQARDIVSLVRKESQNYDSLDRLTVLGLIAVESRGRANAVSPAGARGIMQIMPETGKFINANFSEDWKGTKMLDDPKTNIRYGMWYLNHLQESFPDNEQALLAAYNWGPGQIQDRLEQGQALPKVYPTKVWNARERIRKEMYEYYNAQYRRGLDFSRDPSNFEDHTS